MFIVSDSQGNIITCNRAVLNKLGYAYHDFTKMNLIELHPEETRDEATVFLRKMLSKERTFCPIPFIGKFGQLYAVESRVWSGKWNGKDCIFSVSKDLSEENENLQLFSSIFENNPLPMTITDRKEGKVLEVNPAFLRKTKYKKEEIYGKTVEETDLLVDADLWRNAHRKSILGQRVKDEEITIRRKKEYT